MGFLSLANDIAKDDQRKTFEHGMLIGLCALAAHLGICTVANRAAALCQAEATSPQKKKLELRDFHRAFIVCEHLQYLGIILFLTSILYLSFVMFSSRIHPYIFVGISLGLVVLITISCYWKFSILNEKLDRFVALLGGRGPLLGGQSPEVLPLKA